jgi:4-hydroxybenzoate polyprenyltransferase
VHAARGTGVASGEDNWVLADGRFGWYGPSAPLASGPFTLTVSKGGRMAKALWRLVTVSRPGVWVPAAVIYAGGVAFGPAARATWPTWAGFVFVTMPMGVITFGINDITDITSDALNSRKGGTEGAVVRPTERRLLIRAATACAVTFLLLYLAARRYAAAASILGIILSACAYSVRPVRLKTRPVLDSVSNGFGVACIFCCGYYAGTPGLPDSFPAPHILAALLLCGSALHALTTLLDDDVDKKMGDTTIGVVLGRRRTVGLAAMLFASCFFLVSGPEMTTYFAACSLLGAVVLVHPSQRAIHWLVVVVIVLLLPLALVDIAANIR